MMRLGGGVWELGEKGRGDSWEHGDVWWGGWERGNPFDSYDKYMTRCYNTYF